jgi:hypothetical protein
VSIFYRQAFLFLRELQSRDAEAFRQLLSALQDGGDFDAAFAQAYHMNPARAAGAFFRITGCPPGNRLAGGCDAQALCCAPASSSHGER